ncbi:MAG: sulfur carrier protein ThiS [Acidobacteria bacterium]|nr:sulfur carrier protein ThiS [Acidobacteriota bacterium]
MSTEVEIRLNGERYQVPVGSTVSDLVRRLKLAEDRVAVELDRRIVRRPEWPAVTLQPGAAVEIVQVVGGG